MSDRKIAFTTSHEWVALEEGRATVGITEHAQRELGEIVAIELPKVGDTLLAGEEVCILESTKAAADVYAPLSGKVVAVNDKLAKSPDLINRAPEKEGWLFQMEGFDLKKWERLLTQDQYLEYLEN